MVYSTTPDIIVVVISIELKTWLLFFKLEGHANETIFHIYTTMIGHSGCLLDKLKAVTFVKVSVFSAMGTVPC